MLESFVYSVAGFVVGLAVGKYWCVVHERSFPLFWHSKDEPEYTSEKYDRDAPIPEVIPALKFNKANGEPVIAKEEVHHASPIPRSIAIILILLAALSFSYNGVQQYQRNRDLKDANQNLADQVEANHLLVQQLQHQQGIIVENEKRLEDLVLAISTAKTPGAVTAAIQHFLKSSAAAHDRERKFQQNQEDNRAQHSSVPSGDTRGSPSPVARPSPSNSPEPRPSHSPTPGPSSSPSPSPSSTPLTCVVTPVGKICTPI